MPLGLDRVGALVETIENTQALPLSSRTQAPLVDAHAHIFHDGMALAETAWHRPPTSAPLETFLATLDDAGVRFAVLAAASIFGDNNDYMLEAVRAHKRLRTTVIVPIDIAPERLREMKSQGVVGIRLQFRNVENPPDLGAPEYQAHFKNVADAGLHVHLHDNGDRLPLYIRHIENAGPDLVIDHFGRPPPDDHVNSEGFRAVLAAVDRGRTWVKLSGAFRIDPPSAAKALAAVLLEYAGPQRLLWGSDWPFAAFEDEMTYAKAIAQYYDCVPDAATRTAIDVAAHRFYFT
jgi:predicted TIM-barrel fold metal-dependent hydrolase